MSKFVLYILFTSLKGSISKHVDTKLMIDDRVIEMAISAFSLPKNRQEAH